MEKCVSFCVHVFVRMNELPSFTPVTFDISWRLAVFSLSAHLEFMNQSK